VPTDYSAEDYYREQLRMLVWSGFFNEGDFRQYLEDLEYAEEARPHRAMLAEHGLAQMAEKRSAEATWPATTDCDRLNAVFDRLDSQGILALENAGYTSSDAHGDAWHMVEQAPPGRYRGFGYYHGQDVERAVEGQPLFIGFDAVEESAEAKRTIGEQIAAALRETGFEVDWNGDPETRMSIVGIDWKRRTPWEDWPKRGWLSRFFAD
jgi:hypothetical protein